MREISGISPPGPLGFVPSDAAKRAADTVTLHWTADPRGNLDRVVAIRLSDGGSDNTTYASLQDAVRFQLHYRQCMYVRIRRGGMSPREAQVFLDYHRKCYDAGNLPNYLEGVPLNVPTNLEEIYR